jgi:hypothetical protein
MNGGWIISGFSLLVGGFGLPISCLFRERANKFNWDSKSLGAKTDLYCFSFCLKL